MSLFFGNEITCQISIEARFTEIFLMYEWVNELKINVWFLFSLL